MPTFDGSIILIWLWRLFITALILGLLGSLGVVFVVFLVVVDYLLQYLCYLGASKSAILAMSVYTSFVLGVGLVIKIYLKYIKE